MAELENKKDRPHRVTVTVGYTRNMGNFESLRLDVGLEAEGYGHPDATYARVKEWCEAKLVEAMDEIEAELKK